MAIRDGEGAGGEGKDRPGELGPLPPDGRRVFLADLHLDGGEGPRAQTFRALLKLLAQDAGQTPTELYILGDLFEFWEEYHPQLAAIYERDLAALEEAHRAGVRIVLLYGNRDFAYGRYVRRRLGARILGDGGRVKLSDERWAWVEHGDLLCTADRRYLRFRGWIRGRLVRVLLWLMPWSLAARFIGGVKARTRRDKESKPESVFEIDPQAARRRLEQESCRLLLCGHTHRAQGLDLGDGYRLLVVPPWCETCSGYRDRNGALVPVHFTADGTPVEADASGQPIYGS